MASNDIDNATDPAVTREGKNKATTSGCTVVENLTSKGMNKSVNIDYAGFEISPGQTLTPELEIWFGIEDLKIGVDKDEDDIHDIDALSKIEFRIAILPQGKGLQSPFQREHELQSEHVANECTQDYSEDFHDGNSKKEINGTITLIVEKRGNGTLNILKSYLNGVERRVLVDTGAATSIVHHCSNPKKDRKFRVLDVQRYWIPDWYDITRKGGESKMVPKKEQDLDCSDTYWSSEDEVEDEKIDSEENGRK